MQTALWAEASIWYPPMSTIVHPSGRKSGAHHREIKSRDMMLEIARRDCSRNDVFGRSLRFCEHFWQTTFC